MALSIEQLEQHYQDSTGGTSLDALESAYQGTLPKPGVLESFGKGVVAAGQSAFLEPALKLGVKRYRDGVTFGIPKYAKNFAPYRDVIEATSLPPRGAVGDPGNIDRVRVMAAALHDAKIR